MGVVGATGACETCLQCCIFHSQRLFADTLIRRIGKRAHVLHVMTSFSSQSVLASTLGYALPEILNGISNDVF